MSNLNAHIKKSHGLSWKEAEQKYGISAKTGELIETENIKPVGLWENPRIPDLEGPGQREEKFSNIVAAMGTQKVEFHGLIGHNIN